MPVSRKTPAVLSDRSAWFGVIHAGTPGSRPDVSTTLYDRCWPPGREHQHDPAEEVARDPKRGGEVAAAHERPQGRDDERERDSDGHVDEQVRERAQDPHRRLPDEEWQRAQRPAAVAQLEVQMRPRAPAGAAGDRDPLAARDVLAHAHSRGGQVGVERRVPIAGIHLDELAVALVAARLADAGDESGRRRGHAQRAQDPDVEAGMPATSVLAERRRDRPVRGPGELELAQAVRVRGRARRPGEKQDAKDHRTAEGRHGGGSLAPFVSTRARRSQA